MGHSVAWATVAGIASGVISGGLAGTIVQIGADRRERWRGRLIDSAELYTSTFWEVWNRLNLCLESLWQRYGELSTDASLNDHETLVLIEAQRVLSSLLPPLTKIEVLFGRNSTAATEARHSRRRLEQCLGSLLPDPEAPETDADHAHTRLKEAELALNRFSDAARDWAVSGRARGPLLKRRISKPWAKRHEE